MSKGFFFLMSMFLICQVESKQYYTYLEFTDNKKTNVCITVEKDAQGYIITNASVRDEDTLFVHKCNTDKNYSVVAWEFTNSKLNSKIFGVRNGDYIAIKGLFNGEKVDLKIPIDSSPWYQLFPFDLQNVVNQKDSKVKFWAVSTTGSTALKAAKFKLDLKDTVTTVIRDTSLQTIQGKISLSGMLSMFWHCDAWFQANNGLYVKYFAVNGPPGSPPTTIELLQ